MQIVGLVFFHHFRCCVILHHFRSGVFLVSPQGNSSIGGSSNSITDNTLDGKKQNLATGIEPKLNEVFEKIVKKAENVIVEEEVGQNNLENKESEEVISVSEQNSESDNIDNKTRNTTSDITDNAKDPSNIMFGFFIFVGLCGITTGFFLFQKKQKKDPIK